MALANLIIYYAWENIKSAYNNNKLKISALTSNDKFGFPGGSYSVSYIQDYFECIIKKHETIANNPTVQIRIVISLNIEVILRGLFYYDFNN